jgi:hypothetical protein
VKQKHITSVSLTASAICFTAFAVIMVPGAPLRAEEECVAKPNAPAPAGQHWWYRTDRATKRKCWFLGPKDKEAAARKADRREQAASEAEPEVEPTRPQETPAQVAPNDTGNLMPFVLVPQESVPYLVDWSGLLKDAGIAGTEDTTLREWADEKAAARAAWAMRDPAVPADAQPVKDEERVPQIAAGNSATATIRNAPAAPSGLPAPYIAALLLGGVLPPAIFSILRARRRRTIARNISAKAISADAISADTMSANEGRIPAFLQTRDARFTASWNAFEAMADDPGYPDDFARPDDHARPYGGEEELRRILGVSRQRAA